MRYHVFIEGSRDGTPNGVAHLASSLGNRYGMSPPAVMRRLQEGRFCARTSLELPAAQRLASELEALGAQTSLVAEVAGPGGAAAGGSGSYASGLAAAFAGDRLRGDVPLDLGALGLGALDPGTSAGVGWALSHIDGSEDGTRTGPSAPRPPPIPPRRAQGVPPPIPGTTGRIALGTESSGPLQSDPFLPPDVREAQLRLATRSLPIMAPPVGGTSAETRAPLGTRLDAEPHADPIERPSVTVRFGDTMAESPRARFTAGLALAFLIGLLPAEIYGWTRAATYDDIRADLAADYRAAAESPDRWEALPSARDGAVDRVRARQRRLAISSCIIWLAVAGAAGFIWFRVIDWPRPTAG